jgi:hypothetical protein
LISHNGGLVVDTAIYAVGRPRTQAVYFRRRPRGALLGAALLEVGAIHSKPIFPIVAAATIGAGIITDPII